MGNTTKKTKGLFGEVRIIFQEYDSANLFEIPGEENRDNKIRGWIHGNEVTQFTTVAGGAAWHLPSSPDPAGLFDQIASNKSMTIRARSESIAERLMNAEKAKTVLEWVELIIVEKDGVELSNPDIKQPPLVSYSADRRKIDAVRLYGCRPLNIIPINKSLFAVTFKAASAEPRKRDGGGGGCDVWGCGMG
jgi:hypothetical protein